jgi:2-amino-4-hydroxy-6-hydroxymethyldihydropteridine diphosphokinase|tara:strand:- start:425 stop:937 length:513 start_codon:yes stop_codon:yes gene_type:complete
MIYLNIGSNLNSVFGNRFDNINKSIEYLKKNKIKICKSSNFYETPSYPNKKNPKFINITIEVEFDSSSKTLLKIIHLIQKKMGRIKKLKNDPRICDIDIIDFNNEIFNTPLLTLPHPKCHLRNFVLYPLNEINSNWFHPVSKLKITELIAKLNTMSRIEITRLNKSAILD